MQPKGNERDAERNVNEMDRVGTQDQQRVMTMGEGSGAVVKIRARRGLRKGSYSAQCHLCQKPFDCPYERNLNQSIVTHLYNYHSPVGGEHWKCHCGKMASMKWIIQKHINGTHKGKGNPEYWVAVVKPGRVMFEVEGVEEQVARRALTLASAKLPVKTRFVMREAN